MKKHKKQARQETTVEEFLKYVPKKANLEWRLNSEGIVEITVPKFKSNFGKSLCKLIRKDNTFSAKMDKIGSFVWQEIDGKKNTSQILTKLKKKFPDEKDIDQRLFLFLRQMNNLDYLELYKPIS